MDSKILKTVLKTCELYKDFGDNEIAVLIASGKTKQFSSDENIYTKGESSTGRFGIIVSGSVEAVTESGQVIRKMGSGEIIGEAGSISPKRNAR